VMFDGDLRMVYASNYMLRTAVSVLMQIAEFRIGSADDLYRRALKIDWDRYMDPSDTFSVVPVVQSHHFNHTGFAALKLKDAVADYFRNKTGSRPSVSTGDPVILVNLHISNDQATVSLDSSLQPLFKRGYRTLSAEAPLNEVLAAGMLQLSEWDGSSDLYDPMCGSGTIVIEAAMDACRIPPGKFRKSFGFMKWRNYDKALFESVKGEYARQEVQRTDLKIYGSDISPTALRTASQNIKNAGLEGRVDITCADFAEFRPKGEGAYIIINPPYGERLAKGETDALYGMIGSTLKHRCQGCTAWIITPNRESLKHIGLKPSAKHLLYNGALECLFARYELYAGSRKNYTR